MCRQSFHDTHFAVFISSKLSHVLTGGHGIHGESQSETILTHHDESSEIWILLKTKKNDTLGEEEGGIFISPS